MADSIKEYYESYGKKVYMYLLSLCRNSDTAEELTQEVFYQAIKNLSSYSGKSSVYTWLCGIGRNLWLKELKRQQRSSDYEPDENTPSNDPSPAESAELKDTAKSIMRQIHALPEQEKEIILLRATGEVSFRDIGELFGKTENWARVTYYRAKQKLKR